MLINWITIRVNDFEKTKEFYKNFLGMNVENEFSPDEDTSIAFFSSDNETKIEILHNKNEKIDDSQNSSVSIGMTAENYDELLSEARKRNIIVQEPVLLGGYLLCFFVQDPNGVKIQIIQNNK